MCIQILWILVRVGISIYNKIKNKQYNEIIEDVTQAKEQIEQLVEEYNKTHEDKIELIESNEQ